MLLPAMIRFMSRQVGKITFEKGAGVWPHELRTAQALAVAGYNIHFVKKSEVEYQSSADAFIDGILWEMKSPTSDKTKQIEKRLREGAKQSPYVVFDSRRMKRLPDDVIRREVEKQLRQIKALKRVLYVTKHGEIIDLPK